MNFSTLCAHCCFNCFHLFFCVFGLFFGFQVSNCWQIFNPILLKNLVYCMFFYRCMVYCWGCFGLFHGLVPGGAFFLLLWMILNWLTYLAITLILSLLFIILLDLLLYGDTIVFPQLSNIFHLLSTNVMTIVATFNSCPYYVITLYLSMFILYIFFHFSTSLSTNATSFYAHKQNKI